jgi:predicted transcriptional regulator
MRNTENATKVSQMKRQLEGEKQRRHLLFCIEDHPGLTEYEISQRLNWSRGKVHYHLKILFNQGEVRSKTISNPHPKKTYYTVPWDEMVKMDEDSYQK